MGVHEGHRERLRRRFAEHGLENFDDVNVLELLLFYVRPRQDTNELAHRLIQHFGDFCKVLEAEETELREVDGVGPKSARLIHTVMAFSRYYNLKKRKPRAALDQTERAVEYVRPLFLGLRNEVLYLILLDDKCRPLRDMRIAEGVPNRVQVDTHKLLRDVARTDEVGHEEKYIVCVISLPGSELERMGRVKDLHLRPDPSPRAARHRIVVFEVTAR